MFRCYAWQEKGVNSTNLARKAAQATNALSFQALTLSRHTPDIFLSPKPNIGGNKHLPLRVLEHKTRVRA